MIVLTDRAERLVNRWESHSASQIHTHTHTYANTHSIFFLHLEEWHAHINGWIKERGHHLVDPGANGAAQLCFDFQWTDRDGSDSSGGGGANVAVCCLCLTPDAEWTCRIVGRNKKGEGKKKNFQRLLWGCQQCVTGSVQSKKHFLVLLMFLRKKKKKNTPTTQNGGKVVWFRGDGGGRGGHSTLVVLSLNEVLKLNWLRKWLMCIMELRVALHKGVC